MDSQGSDTYIVKLQDYVGAYNESRHRSIRMAPNDVTFIKVSWVWKRLCGKYSGKKKKRRNRFSTGYQVGISEYKRAFSKGYEHDYTDEMFTVSRVWITKP